MPDPTGYGMRGDAARIEDAAGARPAQARQGAARRGFDERERRRARRARRSGLNSSSFSSSGSRLGAEADPMSGLGNLADAMLVFACGLLIAIVAHWNVDLSVTEILEQEKLTEVDQVESMSEEMVSGSQYNERGTVYEDPATGTLYLLEPVKEGE